MGFKLVITFLLTVLFVDLLLVCVNGTGNLRSSTRLVHTITTVILEACLCGEAAAISIILSNTFWIAAGLYCRILSCLRLLLPLWVVRVALTAIPFLCTEIGNCTAGRQFYTSHAFYAIHVLDVVLWLLYALALLHVLSYLSEKTLYPPYHCRFRAHRKHGGRGAGDEGVGGGSSVDEDELRTEGTISYVGGVEEGGSVERSASGQWRRGAAGQRHNSPARDIDPTAMEVRKALFTSEDAAGTGETGTITTTTAMRAASSPPMVLPTNSAAWQTSDSSTTITGAGPHIGSRRPAASTTVELSRTQAGYASSITAPPDTGSGNLFRQSVKRRMGPQPGIRGGDEAYNPLTMHRTHSDAAPHP